MTSLKRRELNFPIFIVSLRFQLYLCDALLQGISSRLPEIIALSRGRWVSEEVYKKFRRRKGHFGAFPQRKHSLLGVEQDKSLSLPFLDPYWSQVRNAYSSATSRPHSSACKASFLSQWGDILTPKTLSLLLVQSNPDNSNLQGK